MDIEKTKAEFEKSECFKRFKDVVQHTFFDFGTYCIRTDVPRDVEKKIEKLVSGLIFSWKAWKEAKAQAVPEGFVLVPKINSEAGIDSMAMRYRHDFPLLDETYRNGIKSQMRQLYEEAIGLGFYTHQKA